MSDGKTNIKVYDGVFKDIIREGKGPQVLLAQTITVHCTGFLAGEPPKRFWSTKDPGQKTFTFDVGIGRVIKGWDEGCLTMRKGEIARLHIRSDKGYGAEGFPTWGITPNADLVFEIEIL